MRPVMRLWLAAAALIAAGALAAGIALGLRSPQAGRESPAAGAVARRRLACQPGRARSGHRRLLAANPG